MVLILFALWWLRIQSLWKLPNGRDSLWGKLGLILMGRTMLSKASIQFSADGQGCIPSLLFGLKPNYGRGDEGNGDLLQNAKCTHCCIQCPWAITGHYQPTPLLEIPGHSQATLAQSLVGTLFLSPGSWCAQDFVCVLQESVSPVLWKFGNQVPWSPKSNSLGVLSSFARSPDWEVCCGF